MSLTSDIIRGHTETVILARLMGGDSYGYEVSKTVSALSGGEFEFKEGTLYTAFRRLEQCGAIRSYWGDEGSGARRRYYSVTDEGRKQYEVNLQEWERVKRVLESLMQPGTLPADTKEA
jgi:PadR family transcriptional regulator PadR